MALTDEQKLDLVRSAFEERLHSFQDWPTFKTFLQNLTKTQIKSYIVSALQSKADEDGSLVTQLETSQSDKLNLRIEIETDM